MSVARRDRIPLGYLIATSLIGGGLLLLAAISFQKTWSFVSVARIASGVVVGHELDSESEAYFPVVSFEVPEGGTRRIRGNVSSSKGAPTGQSAQVLYDPRNPSRARIKGFFQIWGGTLVASVLGLLIGGGGLLGYFGTPSDRRPPPEPVLARSETTAPCPRCGHPVGRGTLNCPKCFAPQ